ELTLEPEAKPTAILVTAVDKDNKPVAAAVKVKGEKEQELKLTDKPEPARLELAPGKYTLDVNADGYLSQTRDVQIAQGVEMPVAFQLQPQPKKKLVVVRENKIDILQQVHFATGKATIHPDSFQLLDQVVDAIIKSNIKKLRVEGHTDNKGSKSANLKLSQDRATAVADYMIKSGIDASRVEAVGYGDSKPIAPNLTERGRQLNRRVEFVITDR
ncbi:MAG: OmpA family protein, partial [Myxococcaceae bacterium]